MRSIYFVMALCLGTVMHSSPQETGPVAATNQPAQIVPKVYRIGGGVLLPRVLKEAYPSFTGEARAAKVSGSVLVYLQVDEDGNPQKLHIVRGLGYGLDENALATVSRYKFAPATLNGKPVRIEMNMKMNYKRVP